MDFGASQRVVGNGTEGDLLEHRSALTSAYILDNGNNDSLLAQMNGNAGFEELYAPLECSGSPGVASFSAYEAEGIDVSTGNTDAKRFAALAGSSETPGAVDFSGYGTTDFAGALPRFGNGTEGDLREHAAALASTYQLDDGTHNSALRMSLS
ncbi:hypothetical protein L596_014697 [Steinernema carpocapsae]|uniref:Uncharacterized protein n=1 Tax=Steinernema carpocapsae TaxID=34508 RepID=A0A4U5NCV2_STECR|nr:hypothetical protein L596_014697 [Steinernema carpocapsae]